MKKTFDVLLLGYYGFGNLGDELLAEASIAALERCSINKKRIAVLTADCQKYKEKFQIVAFNRWSLREIICACFKSKMLILGGGGLFQDSSSVKSCVYYFAVVLIARILGAKAAAVGQSVGPLKSAFGRFLTAKAFNLCSHISVRDKNSADLLESFGVKSNIVNDLVMSLKLTNVHDENPVLLFNVRGGYSSAQALAVKECCRIADNLKVRVRGIALSDEDFEELSRLHENGRIKLESVIKIENRDDFAAATAGAVGAVGMRLHFIVLCVISEIPVIGCAYDPKVSGFCDLAGIDCADEKENAAMKKAVKNFICNAQETIDGDFKKILTAVYGEDR